MKTKVTFTLPAAVAHNASEGYLLGDFNNWNYDQAIQLQKTEDGSMVAEVALPVGQTYQYRYLLNDGRWVNDYQHTTWTEVYGNYVENCVIEVPAQIEPAAAQAAPEEVAVPVKKAVTKKAPAVGKAKAPKVLADDLLKIQGIDKKVFTLLKKEGITTYKHLAKCTITSLKGLLSAAGDKFVAHNPASWPKQAKLAAAAKWDELNELQSTLKSSK